MSRSVGSANRPILAAVIGAGTAIVLAIVGATWQVGARLGRIESHGAVIQERVDRIADDVKELKGQVGRRLAYEQNRKHSGEGP